MERGGGEEKDGGFVVREWGCGEEWGGEDIEKEKIRKQQKGR